ncbi:MAG: hypothetical protein ACYTHK_10555 [Planctomycetota bacterium]
MRWIFRIFILLVVLIGGFFLSSYWWLDGAAKKAIEVAGAEAMGVTVELDSINIGILRGEARLKKLHVANPPGYKKDFFFDLKEGDAGVKLRTVTEETIEIPKIELVGITMNIEPDDASKYNYERILENIEKFSRKQETPEEEASEKKIVVRELILRDIQVYYRLKGLNFIEAPVLITEPIVMRNIGEEGSEVDMEELMSIIITGALKGIASRMPEVIGNGIKAGIGKLGDVGKVALEATGDAMKHAAEKTGKEIKKILGGD